VTLLSTRAVELRTSPVVIELPASLQFLTQKQVAEVINVSERTLERWRVEGTGPKFVAMGPRRRLYRMSDVDDWARSQTFGSTSEAKR
jgi:excisionase family DNA binding protein